MGMFDSFFDTDGTEYQSKAFGKRLARYRLGDPVTLVRAAVTEDEYNAERAGNWHPTPNTVPTYQVQTSNDAYLDITEHRFTGISSRRNPQVPLFDYFGRDITRLEERLTDPAFVKARAQTATLVGVHPTACRVAYLHPDRDTGLTERFNVAVAALLAHCADMSIDAPIRVPEREAHIAYLTARAEEQAAADAAKAAARAAAGFADYDPVTATPAQRRAYMDWHNDVIRRAAEAETDAAIANPAGENGQSSVPASVYLLPAHPIGEQVERVADAMTGRGEDGAPALTLPEIAAAFHAALQPLRGMADASLLFTPVAPPARAGRPSQVRRLTTGEATYADMVIRLRDADLLTT